MVFDSVTMTWRGNENEVDDVFGDLDDNDNDNNNNNNSRSSGVNSGLDVGVVNEDDMAISNNNNNNYNINIKNSGGGSSSGHQGTLRASDFSSGKSMKSQGSTSSTKEAGWLVGCGR